MNSMKDTIQKVPTLKHNMGPFTVHEGTNRTGGKMVGVYDKAAEYRKGLEQEGYAPTSTASNQRHMLGIALHEIQHAVWEHRETDRPIQGIKVCCGGNMVVAEIELTSE